MAPQETTFAHIENNTHPCWWKDRCLRRNVVHLLGISLCVYYLGYDQNLLNGLQPIKRWQEYFNHPSSSQLGLATASIFFPAIVTAFVGDWISLKFGRRWGIGLGASLIVVFIGSRWIIGAGGGITKVCAPALLHEISHPRLRAQAGATYYAFAYVGGVFAAWICFGGLYIQSSWSWRFPTLFQLAGPVVVIAMLFDMPESPRWLMKQGRVDDAHRVLAKHHANGDMDDPLVLHEMQEIRAALEAEKEQQQTSYLDFFKTPANRRRLFVILVISVGTNWVGNGVVSYYLSPILKLVGITKPVEGLTLVFISTTFAQFVDRIGRRPLWLTSTGGMLLTYCVITALSATFANTQKGPIGVAQIFFAFYCIAWTIQCYSYTTEILPYSLRTRGLGIFVAVQNAALAFNTYVNPIALSAIGWKYYTVFIATTAVIFVIIWFFFPEIKGLTLDEISHVFDKGRGAVEELNAYAGSVHEDNGKEDEAYDRK
ncbi:hexose transporter [Trichosporon asahii var. asahii CBS 8904]|uniref:Hexose transporter n=1 Tax=Trichosporon asahii var. asahii (strain CBS 8904) TaxID=1220162 RepID=K1UZY4_TRIAC|nr:hexose transporter [Trichosporon asahii var. asahii CBS 8904]